MTKRIKNKIRAVIVIMIILLWVVFCFCLFNRTGSVHYYPVLVSQTFNNELNKHKCISLDGKIYCYSDSLFKRGIYELSDNEKKFLINTEKIYSMATYNNIVAYETKDNIFFYDCASGSIRYFSEDEISKIREYLDWVIFLMNIKTVYTLTMKVLFCFMMILRFAFIHQSC